MRRLVIWNVMSLDGFFEGPMPWSLDFHLTVWGDELEAFSLSQGEEIGTLLFGRKTYVGMSNYWQSARGPVADMMNGIEKAVISRTLDAAVWNNTRLLRGEAVDQVRILKRETDKKDIFVFGSADLVSSLLAENLVDEYRICIAPVMLGEGNALFKQDGIRKDFSLLDARSLETGGIILRYQRVASQD